MAGGLDLILDAATFAAKKHCGKRRKGRFKTPYINHPLAVARALCVEGKVEDAEVIAAALLHDTVEDTDTKLRELRARFGKRVASLVEEVTDDKSLPKATRKRMQVLHAPRLSKGARQIKLADKLSNLRDVYEDPPPAWSKERKHRYFDWGKEVVDQIRSANPALARKFDEAYRKKRRLA